MSLIRFVNTAAAIAVLAAPALAHGQVAQGPVGKATTPAAAAKATGRATTDAAPATQTQGTAWAVKQSVQAAPAGAAAAAPSAPILTPKGDIIQTLSASGQFTTFLKALDATNLTGVLKSNSNLTVFAPTNAAFAALPPGELDRLMADKAALQKLLTHHIINARVDQSKIRNAKGPVPSVAGNPIELDGTGEALKVDNANIVQADVMATNGIIDVVDQVLTPATGPQAAAGATTSSTTAAPGSR